MAEHSNIEWTHHTVNLYWGCTEVHSGCDQCYARKWSERFGLKLWSDEVKRLRILSSFSDLDRYQRKAAKTNQIHRVLVGSMMDIFEKDRPLINPRSDHDSTGRLREEFFSNICEGKYPNLLLLLLTKRETNINKLIPDEWKINPPKNVMFGASATDQITFDRVKNNLKKVNGRKFLSVEPQLSLITPTDISHIDWIIQGGESGTNRRPFNIDWAKPMMKECQKLHIPYFFKQIDKVIPIPRKLAIKEYPPLSG